MPTSFALNFTPGRTAGGRLQPWCTRLQIPCILAEDPLALRERAVPEDLECLGSPLSHHCNILSKRPSQCLPREKSSATAALAGR